MAIIIFSDKLQLTFNKPYEKLHDALVIEDGEYLDLVCEAPQGSVFMPKRDQTPATYTINFTNCAPCGSLNCYNLYEYGADTPFNTILPTQSLQYKKY